MRRLFLAVCLAFAAAPAFARETWIEAPVTLSLSLAATGAEQIKPGQNGTSTATVSQQRSRLGNADVLAALVDADVISAVKGWHLVALWESWIGEDSFVHSGYRFYVRRGRGTAAEVVAVPDSILALEPIAVATGGRQRIDEFLDPLGGSEKQEAYSRLTFETSVVTGNVGGVLSGTGRYLRVGADRAVEYIPGPSHATLQGMYQARETSHIGIAEGSIIFGAARFVDPYAQPSHSSGGTSGPTVDVEVDTSITVSVN